MPSGDLFLIKADGSLTNLSESPYESEALLQELLARYPDLLPGGQIDPDAPRRWLLVQRELGVPAEADGAGRWSLDHLFIDQEAVPTLVEVKRATDTRARREVVAQMLDYAANGVSFWPVESIRDAFERRCAADGVDPTVEINRLLGPSGDPDAFWPKVKQNLESGRIRMLFVADEIPSELRRIVEFLDGQMSTAEVVAVEIRQYTGEGLRTLAPRVVTQSALARAKKKGEPPKRSGPWDESRFFERLANRGDPVEARVARRLFDWCTANFDSISYGRGTTSASFAPVLDVGGSPFTPIRVYTGSHTAYVELQLGEGIVAPFDTPEGREHLLKRFAEIPGVSIGKDAKYPSPYLKMLEQQGGIEPLLDVVTWIRDTVREGVLR